MVKALQGIRVLDLSRVLAGPYCTQMLGDLGAEIIKIEKPGDGDDTRGWGPPFMKDGHGADTSESAYYLSCNRNKKSVAIDIKSAEGQALLHRLLESCDILIQNFKVGGLDQYGLGYDQLKDKYPALIYAAISGFGQNGPLAGEPGYDFVAQAMSGLMASTGEPDGQPMKVGVALSDIITGLNTAVGILAALHNRTQTGKGQMVDVSLLDCSLAAMTNIAQYYLTSSNVPPRVGNAHASIVPYQAFETKDGHIILAVGNDGQFRRFCDFIGNSDWAEDARFATNKGRVMHRDVITPMIIEVMKTQTTDYWIEGLQGVDVPCGPVNTMDKVFQSNQIKAREMEIQMEHTLAGHYVSLVGSPLKLSETPVSYDQAPPTCGQHTEEVLGSLLGLSPDNLSDLEERGVIGTPPKT